MTSNEKYIRLTTATNSVRSYLRLCCISWYSNEDLDEYYVYILEYINSQIILSGSETLLQCVKKFSDLYKAGSDKIISGNTIGLYTDMGITAPPSQDNFIFAWSNLMTSIYSTLQVTYSYLFATISVDCLSGCDNCSDTPPNVDSIYESTGNCGCNG